MDMNDPKQTCGAAALWYRGVDHTFGLRTHSYRIVYCLHMRALFTASMCKHIYRWAELI